MASFSLKAENLSVDDVLLLPFGKEATILAVKPVGPRTRYVQFKTQHGWTRVEVGTEVSIKVGYVFGADNDDDDFPVVGEMPPLDSIPYQGKHFKSV